MTPEEMRVAIAQKHDWVRRPDLDYLCYDVNTRQDVKRIIYANNGVTCCEEDLPNYPRDLNAMHEARGALNADECSRYAAMLKETITSYCVLPNDDQDERNYQAFILINAEAQQHAEAFCRVFWPERFA